MYERSNFLTMASTCARVSQGGVGSRPAKNMLYSASSFFSPDSSNWSSRSVLVGAATMLPHDQQPHERQPQLTRVRHRPVVDEDFRRMGRTDDREQVAQAASVGRPEPRM